MGQHCCVSPWSPSNHNVELPEVHHGSSPPAAALPSQGCHRHGNAIITLCLDQWGLSLSWVWFLIGYSLPVSRPSTSLPVVTLQWLGRRVDGSMSTTCSQACTAVAMAMMRKVHSPVSVSLWLVHSVCLCHWLRPSAPAHRGVVRGVATDTLNQLTLTAGSDSLLRFWRFKTRKQEEQLKLNAAPASMMLHRDR